jgi:uncharacterized SAM-binding protein YcdF (DUF218 family)
MITKKRKLLWLLPLMLLLWILYVAISICIYSYKSDSNSSDAAIVLGAAVWDSEPSPVFKERIDYAINLYKAGTVKKIVFTGGVGENDILPEAIIAKAYATHNGVDKKDILLELSSKTTFENLKGAKGILDDKQLGRVLVVSDPLHMKRSMKIARDLGMNAYPSPTPTTQYKSLKSKTGFLSHEIYFYTTYMLRKK